MESGCATGPAPTSPPLLKSIREAELLEARDYFKAGQRVLDYGGGNGYVASRIAALGCEVESVDVKPKPGDRFWPVHIYDGHRLPYPDAHFDVVFSSNTLEHLPDVVACLREMTRVLKPGGVMVHIVPSHWWRFGSNISHYAWIVRETPRRLRQYHSAPKAAAASANAPPRRRPNAWRAFLAPTHAEHASNAITEVLHYTAWQWRRIFRQASLDVIDHRASRIFYAEHLILPLTVSARRRLSRVLGSSTHVFVVRKKLD